MIWKRISEALTIIMMLAIFGALAIVFYYTTNTEAKLSPVLYVVSQAMLVYLFFCVVRVVIMLVLSFSEYFFRKKASSPLVYPLISIIVPCYNEEKVIKNAVTSLEVIDYPNFEVIIVDDGSHDLTLIEAKKLEKRAKVRVVYQENGGKAAALNRGISEANGDFVLCVDADSLLNAAALRRGIAYFEQTPSLSAVAGSVHIGNANNLTTLFQKLEYVIGLNFYKTAQSFLSCVMIIPGPVGLFRKSAVISVGGYHSDTFAEDCDLTVRLLTAGHEIAYCPDMIATTEAPEDFRSLIAQRYRWSRGIVQVVTKNAHWMMTPHRNFRNWLITMYLMTESVAIPLVNFIFSIVTIEAGLVYGAESLFGQFFAGLTLLDMVLALYSVFTDRQSILLVVLGGVNRVTYGLALEILRFLSLIDEAFGIPMNWGKLVRKGLS